MGLLHFLFGDDTKVYDNGHPYVDLGLSVNWAKMNVGAHFDYECGNLYMWGDIKAKKHGDGRLYPLRNGVGGMAPFTRYVTDTFYGKQDYQTKLLRKDDVAHHKMRGDWRMPTKKEWEELYNKCRWQLVTINDVITAFRVTGPSDKCIYLPFCDSHRYWTSSLYSNNDSAYALRISEREVRMSFENRDREQYVRGVLPKTK